MKILFVQRQVFALPGIASLAAASARAGHTCLVLMENAEKDLPREIAAFCPDAVGITLCSSDLNWFRAVIPAIRRSAPGAFLLAGGIHPTIHPALLEETEELDAVCVGEGEEAVVELLAALGADKGSKPSTVNSEPDKASGFGVQGLGNTGGGSGGGVQGSGDNGGGSRFTVHGSRFTDFGPAVTSIRNLHVRSGGTIHRNPLRPLIADLDAYPEDREVYFRRYPSLADDTLLQYLSSRGCPFPCSFCVNETLNRIFKGLGPVQRRQSPEFALGEIARLRDRYRKAQTVFFIDDLFLLDRDWLKSFLPRYRERIGLPYICSAGPGTIDAEVADLLKETGCASVEFGIETGSEEKRRGVFNKKAFTDAEFRRQIGLVKERGIEVYAPSMFVFPGETVADAFRTVELYHELRVDHPFSSFLFPYPDTRIFETAVRAGCLPPDFKAEDLPGNYFTRSVCAIPHRRTIENVQYLFYFFVRFPGFYRRFRWLARLPFPLRAVRYAGLFFWFKNWKRMGYGEAIRYFWRFRRSR